MKHYCRLAGAALLACAGHAQADISYAQRITVDASGGMSMFSSEGTVLTQIAGDRARIENDFKMKSRLMQSFSDSGNAGSIVRLDKELNWSLFPDKRQYSEHSFAELRAQQQQMQAQMRESQAQGGGLPVSSEGCQWSEGEVEFERPKGTEKVAGIKTSRNIARLNQSCSDPQTGNTCEITWTMEAWLAKKVPAEKEALAFRTAWAEAMGMGESMSSVMGPAAGLLGMFASNWEEVAAELEQMRGYPLRTIMQMEIGGEQCKTASGAAIAMDELWSDASTAAYNAALAQTGSETGKAVTVAATESLGGGVGSSIGGAAVGAATSELVGGLTGMFMKKKEKPQPAADSAPARVTVFTISSEVTDWSEIEIPQERFDEPVDWKKL